MSVDGIQENDVCIPPDEPIASNQRIRIISIDYFLWMNAITNYLTVAYSKDGKIVRLLAHMSSANTGTQIAGSKYLNVPLPWGYKFVIAWKMTLASHHTSCCVLYQIETADDAGEMPIVPPTRECSFINQAFGLCGGAENGYN